MTLGLDLSDGVVRAVIVTPSGTVVGRAEQAAGVSGVAAAAAEAVRRVQQIKGTAGIDAVGIALQAEDHPASAAIQPALSEVPGSPSPQVIAVGPAMTLAETWCGAAKGLSTVITFAIGEHVSAGLMMGGEIWRGVNGLAGSVGWMALNPVEREDYRRFGGLEAEVGAAGIVRRLVWRIKSGDQSGVADQVGGNLARLTPEHVFAAARAGDGVCISVVRDTAKYVGMAVSNLAVVLDPEAVVLGGTLASSGDMLLDAIRLECGRRLRPGQGDSVKILLSTLGADAVAIGAARAAQRSSRAR